MPKRLLLLLAFSFTCAVAPYAQQISGYVLTEGQAPVPYANIYITQLQTGTTADESGYFFLTLPAPGEYELIVSSLGYETQTLPVTADDEPLRVDVFLPTSSVELEEVVVRASKKDPAYAIIQHAIDHKKEYLKSINSFRSEVYVKATELVEKEERHRQKRQSDDLKLEDSTPEDPFAETEKAKQELLGNLNMVEMQLTLNYAYPKQYKEERTGYKLYGNKKGLFIPRFGEVDFNFYRNLVHLHGIAAAPIISPLSSTAILSYKYKLIESVEEDGQLVHKIEIIPRKTGNSTCSGYIYINDGLWNINRIAVTLPEDGLKFFDAFQLRLDYRQLPDERWIPYRQEFNYETQQGRYKTFKGSTTIRFEEYEADYAFPPDFFDNEIVRTTREAYERDTAYWKATRPESLTAQQQQLVALRDSIERVHNSKEYQDSITAAYNKVSFLELIWDGVGWRNNDRKLHLFLGSIPALIDFSVVGGFRIGPYLSGFKRWENGRMMSLSGRVHYGFRNEDVQGYADGWMRYNPHRLADVSLGGGRAFQSINTYDAFLNQLRPSNYILNDELYAGHRIELFNGFYLRTDMQYQNRQSIVGLNDTSFLTSFIEDTEEVLDFENYQAFITDWGISYTPAQQYMTEPNRKVVLGSKFPTFSLRHKRGWRGPLGSDVDFDYLELEIKQDLLLGIFGHSLYNVEVGNFINTRGLEFIDYRRFRQSDPIWYSSPRRSFQILDTALATTSPFVEFHLIHHFNGALINNLPLIKKTGIRLVAGGGLLWLSEGKFRHEELFAGIERVFKLGARRRLRVGLFGVAADGNYTKPQTTYKIALDIIDTWKRDWRF